MATFTMLLSMTLLSLHTVFGAVNELSLDPCPTDQKLNSRDFLKVQITADRDCSFSVQHNTPGGRLLFKVDGLTLVDNNNIFRAEGGSTVINQAGPVSDFDKVLQIADNNLVNVSVKTGPSGETSGTLYIYAAGTTNVPNGDIIVKPCPATEFFTTSNFPEKFPNKNPGGSNFISFSLKTKSGKAEDVKFTFYVSDFRLFGNPKELNYKIIKNEGETVMQTL